METATVTEIRGRASKEGEGKLDACCAWILDTMNSGGTLTAGTAVAAGHTQGTYYMARRRLKQMGALAKRFGVSKPASSGKGRDKMPKAEHRAEIVRAPRAPPKTQDEMSTLTDLFARLREEFGVLELHYKDGELEIRRKVKVQ